LNQLNRFKQAIRTDFPPDLRIEDGVRGVTVFLVLPILGVDLLVRWRFLFRGVVEVVVLGIIRCLLFGGLHSLLILVFGVVEL